MTDITFLSVIEWENSCSKPIYPSLHSSIQRILQVSIARLPVGPTNSSGILCEMKVFRKKVCRAVSSVWIIKSTTYSNRSHAQRSTVGTSSLRIAYFHSLGYGHILASDHIWPITPMTRGLLLEIEIEASIPFGENVCLVNRRNSSEFGSIWKDFTLENLTDFGLRFASLELVRRSRRNVSNFFRLSLVIVPAKPQMRANTNRPCNQSSV